MAPDRRATTDGRDTKVSLFLLFWGRTMTGQGAVWCCARSGGVTNTSHDKITSDNLLLFPSFIIVYLSLH